ncbi:peptidoglycan DD-metalloendopeptidase family protein [Erysipelothrix sp. HDW6C]|uniref:peptidoglycan DD-metalloendopeptidase family protein n=1 Tax=Erysipelothrix sp. HDW6C TaxID=2714930 RepID=UPI00140E1CFA|nr:peptidoglycan DD-metalloendopeptidase family protein [Erysipelothrix sp. HDW6C]QIK69959.1 peptidoglycan DD-metalloendopeptidase family protein [Erysipelothrix sp. HDW6C]
MLLPKMLDYLRSPVNSSWVNFEGHKDGSAMDLGFFIGEPTNQLIHASADAKVFEVSYDSAAGNLIVLGSQYSNTHDLWLANAHMESLPTLKAGETVKLGQQLGRMGNTGQSHGPHDHFRVSIVPKGTPFTWSNFDKYRVDPYNYVYAYADQYVRGMRVKPAVPFVVAGGSELPIVVEVGNFSPDRVINVRDNPSTKNGNVVATYEPGESVAYEGYVKNEGYIWLTYVSSATGERRYMVSSPNVQGEPDWGTFS